ncbi:hypothetical protein MPTK1_7g06600 [Marchantia polymorpha subsp. ruderalis]|uniref:COBRA-like protein n=2 Tax=Marchantia polymorpha TaxID=3197 RepID=A0AAF6BWT9_MARPO|nr:hypothetical protein MARPO_0057s0007 [Marchantia polymorpha]BBN16473.1 hypothetical protein Mp_7g06600 [Marchantia polymorpha subsp. ruderalis]|eukprot:PTQ37364.1 hypothetical protein MARPO_0057s0007 [Marchantia polymorpha]
MPQAGNSFIDEQAQLLTKSIVSSLLQHQPRMATMSSLCIRSFWTLVLVSLIAVSVPPAGAWDPLDPNGNILIRWDIMGWTADGYVATVNIINTQQYRGLKSYQLGWHWGKKEIIWTMQGARATEQGDCTRVPTTPPPHSCISTPEIIDLQPGVAYNQQTANCCRNGVISPVAQDPKNSISSFQITVGRSGNTNTTILIPEKLTLKSPDPGYTCSALKKVLPTKFPSPDGKRNTQAYVTWNATCAYSQFLAQKAPTCCVSLSAFYSSKIVPCMDCACNCAPNSTSEGLHQLPGTDQTCVAPNDKKALQMALTTGKKAPNLFCTKDMCPIKIHWHLKENYKEHWRAKVTITNRNLQQNYTNWNLVLQHPNFVNLTTSFSFTQKALTPYGDVANDTSLFWGVKYYNDMLMQAGAEGNVQSELLFAKDSYFTLNKGWGFPSRVYFNGDDCVLPDAADYPMLPNGSTKVRGGLVVILCTLLSAAISLTSLF